MCAVVSTIKENTRRKSCSRLATAQGKTHSKNAVAQCAELKNKVEIILPAFEGKSGKLANNLLPPKHDGAILTYYTS